MPVVGCHDWGVVQRAECLDTCDLILGCHAATKVDDSACTVPQAAFTIVVLSVIHVPGVF